MTEKPAKPAKPAKRVAKTTTARRPAKPRQQPSQEPSHDEISTRAYFIHLEEGLTDEVGNWLRAEHELTRV